MLARLCHLLVFCVFACTSFTSKAQDIPPIKLSGDTSANIEVWSAFSVNTYKLSSDGNYLVYLQVDNADNSVDLYSTTLSGGIPTLLYEAPGFTGQVREFLITPDSSTVVFSSTFITAENGTEGELYSVSIDGGTTTKLNSDDVGGLISLINITSDSDKIVFQQFLKSSSRDDVYITPINNRSIIRLTPETVTGSSLYEVELSFDGSRVVYRADHNVSSRVELFSVSINGGMITRLNPNLVSGRDVEKFKISPDSSKVLYTADPDANDVYELFSAPISGGVVIKLNHHTSGNGWVTDFEVAPDGTYVAYRERSPTTNRFELRTVSLSGGATTKINQDLGSFTDVDSRFQINSDSLYITYIADQDINSVQELYAAKPDGTGRAKLNQDLQPSQKVFNPLLSPDGQRVIYLANPNVSSFDLFSVPITGGTPTKINNTPDQNFGDITSYMFTPDSNNVVYLTDNERNDVHELYGVSSSGGLGVRINSPFISINSDVFEKVLLGNDSMSVVYLADQDIEGKLELFLGRFAINSIDDSEDICFPVRTQSRRTALVCL